MSQSDYLHHKKISLELKSQTKLSPILTGMDYTLYKQYSLVKNIKNTSQLYNQLVPTETQVIFGIETPKSDNCPDFTTCKNTNTRSNRVAKTHVAFTPSVANIPSYVKHKKIRKCENCCNTIVSSNTNMTNCSNTRLNYLCNCSKLNGLVY
jgi:hypothetical protein